MALTLGWFSTARGPPSRKLLAAAHDEIAAGRLKAEIAVVFCNREPGEDPQTDLFLEQVRGYGLPLVCYSYTRYRRGGGRRRGAAGGRSGPPRARRTRCSRRSAAMGWPGSCLWWWRPCGPSPTGAFASWTSS